MRVHSICHGFFKLDGGAMFGVVPKMMWNKLNPADEYNLTNWAMRSLLIEDGPRLILIDTGMGNKQDDKFMNRYHLSKLLSLKEALQGLGYVPSDVTDVILTHLHFDHAGGALIKNEDGEIELTCPKASYWSNQAHWNWATMQPNPREKASFLQENLLPLQERGVLKMIHTDQELVPFSEHVQIRFSHGHTSFMMLPQIEYQNRSIVYMADLIPASFHLPLAYVISYDSFPLTAMQEKDVFLKEALNKNFVLFFEHDPLHECCTLQATSRGILVKDVFDLKDMQQHT